MEDGMAQDLDFRNFPKVQVVLFFDFRNFPKVQVFFDFRNFPKVQVVLFFDFRNFPKVQVFFEIQFFKVFLEILTKETVPLWWVVRFLK
jgi:hypothetical protein